MKESIEKKYDLRIDETDIASQVDKVIKKTVADILKIVSDSGKGYSKTAGNPMLNVEEKE